jgi:hypothetical protein
VIMSSNPLLEHSSKAIGSSSSSTSISTQSTFISEVIAWDTVAGKTSDHGEDYTRIEVDCGVIV